LVFDALLLRTSAQKGRPWAYQEPQLNRAQLEALYGSPVEQLADPDTGGAAFLPG